MREVVHRGLPLPLLCESEESAMSLALLSLTVLSMLRQATSAAPPSVAAAWYAGWHADSTPAFPLSNVSWSNYNTLIYSFA